MSYRSFFDDECPSPYEARREGEEIGYRGWGESNPYSERTRENRDQPYCEEAEQAWRMGRYAGEDQKREEEDREARHQAYLAQEERKHQEQQQIEYEEECRPSPKRNKANHDLGRGHPNLTIPPFCDGTSPTSGVRRLRL